MRVSAGSQLAHRHYITAAIIPSFSSKFEDAQLRREAGRLTSPLSDIVVVMRSVLCEGCGRGIELYFERGRGGGLVV